jgi:FkbM family methyltransferase
MILNQYLELFLRSVHKSSPINVVYDIGASNGEWASAMKRQVLPEAEIIMFEANPIHEETLARTGFRRLVGTALSKPGVKEVTFYSGGTTTGDSYYKENTSWYNNAQEMTLPCVTLDEVIVKGNFPMPDFIKMDTQGSELDILDGATRAMQFAKVIYMECPIIPYNIGAPNIGDYIEKMRVNSFVPVGLLETHYAENTLVQIDIMFMQNALKQKIAPNVDIRPLG